MPERKKDIREGKKDVRQRVKDVREGKKDIRERKTDARQGKNDIREAEKDVREVRKDLNRARTYRYRLAIDENGIVARSSRSTRAFTAIEFISPGPRCDCDCSMDSNPSRNCFR